MDLGNFSSWFEAKNATCQTYHRITPEFQPETSTTSLKARSRGLDLFVTHRICILVTQQKTNEINIDLAVTASYQYSSQGKIIEVMKGGCGKYLLHAYFIS